MLERDVMGQAESGKQGYECQKNEWRKIRTVGDSNDLELVGFQGFDNLVLIGYTSHFSLDLSDFGTVCLKTDDQLDSSYHRNLV
jgi:hypothetical protein